VDDDLNRGEPEDEGASGRADREEAAPANVVLRPLSEDHAADLRAIHERPEVIRWWDEPEDDFPWDEPESTRLTILVDGKVGGMIQYWEEDEPKYRHAGLDLFIDPALHNNGIGTWAVREVARYLFEARGHHRVEIDPAADNAAAIRVYEKAGFKPVGLTRRSERDPDGKGWHDALLMDMLSTELILEDE
jgi:aminoglycoside 6'-N-acetyltransferase